MRIPLPALVCWILLVIAHRAPAEPAAALTELGVDQVVLKRGPRLLGAVLDRAKNGTLTVAVSRVWLKSAHPKFYETCAAAESIERRAALDELLARLADWTSRRDADKELAFFLKKQKERVERSRSAENVELPADDAEFLLLTLDPQQVERVFLQPPQRKQVAAVAWRERLTGVETRSVASLVRELEKQAIDPTGERVDLSERLSIHRQSDAEWAARQAVVEYQFRKTIDFQGTGDLTIRTGAGVAAPGPAELLASVMQTQIAAQLSDLVEEPTAAGARQDQERWLKSAQRAAEREDAGGFRITRVTPDALGQKTMVETRFVARMPGGQWESVWKDSVTVDATRINQDAVDRIANNPQVKRALDLLRAAGLAAGEDAVQTALRIGAATRQAQQAADGKFLEFRDRYLQRLEGPPLRWDVSP